MARPVPSPSDPSAELVHDHTPRHGGVVGMAGSRHVEAALGAGGVLRVHLTDLHRAPLPLDGVRAHATVRTAAGDARIPLEVRDGALEGRIPSPGGAPVEVRVEAAIPHAEPVLIDFTLPVAAVP